MKPYDPTQIVRKLEAFASDDRISKNVLTEVVANYVPPVSVVHDSIEFRPYILAALADFGEIMGLDTRKHSRYGE